MAILTDIRKEYIQLRKEKSGLVSFCSFVISEIEKIGKNVGNRETTEDEAIRVLNKMKTTLLEVVNHSKEDAESYTEQLKFIEKYLPKEVGEDEVEAFIDSLIKEGLTLKKDFMPRLKNQFGALVNMKMASAIVDKKLQ